MVRNTLFFGNQNGDLILQENVCIIMNYDLKYIRCLLKIKVEYKWNILCYSCVGINS